MEFEELLRRWMDAEMEVATCRLCRPGARRPDADFLCAQLKSVAAQWYAELFAELGRARQQLPRI